MIKEYLKQFGTEREEIRTSPNSILGQIAQQFAEDTIEQMKEDVQKASGQMASSIGFDIRFENGQFIIDFLADDYWDYLNSGVDGVQQSAGAIPNVKDGVVQSFKTLNPSPKMVEAFGGGANYGRNGEQGNMQNWMASKGIIADDGDYNSLAYLLARATKRDGIEPSNFVNDAFSEQRIEKMEQLLLDKLNEIL